MISGSTTVQIGDRIKNDCNSSDSSIESVLSATSLTVANETVCHDLQPTSSTNAEFDNNIDIVPRLNVNDTNRDFSGSSTDRQQRITILSNPMNDRFGRLSGGEADTDEFEILFPESRLRRNRLARRPNRGKILK